MTFKTNQYNSIKNSTDYQKQLLYKPATYRHLNVLSKITYQHSAPLIRYPVAYYTNKENYIHARNIN